MKMTIESTTKIVELNGLPARVWEGKTAAGVPVHCFITRVMIHNSTSPEDAAEFERELVEQRAPSIEVAAIPLKFILAVFLAFVLAPYRLEAAAPAATTVIDCGSAADANFVGGSSVTAPDVPGQPTPADSTARYGNFTYRLPAANIPYVVTFRWFEHFITTRGQRLMQVRVNDQIIFDKFDLFATAGFRTPFSRSVVVMGADELLTIQFVTQSQNALVSSIEITPLFEIFSHTSGLVRVDLAGGRSVTGVPTLPEWYTVPGWGPVQ